MAEEIQAGQDFADWTPKVGEILLAKWLAPSEDSESGPTIRGRQVIVTAIDSESVAVMPIEPEQVSYFRYSGRGYPSAKTEEGTIVILMPRISNSG